MKYKTLNKIMFGFCITVPNIKLNDSLSSIDKEKSCIDDFAVGDYVRFADDDSRDGELMLVVGFLKPYYVQVVQMGVDFTEEYDLYDVYPEDIEQVDMDEMFKKCMLNYI